MKLVGRMEKRVETHTTYQFLAMLHFSTKYLCGAHQSRNTCESLSASLNDFYLSFFIWKMSLLCVVVTVDRKAEGVEQRQHLVQRSRGQLFEVVSGQAKC